MSPIPGKLVEGVLKRVLAGDVTPALTSELAAIGIDLSAPLLALYPREVWYQAVALTANALFPQLDSGLQLRQLGKHIIDCLQTRRVVKGHWLTMAKLAGPSRALKQAIELTQYGPVKLTIAQLAKRDFEIVAEETQQSEFLGGLLEGAIALLGGKNPSVVVTAAREASTVFRATWG